MLPPAEMLATKNLSSVAADLAPRRSEAITHDGPFGSDRGVLRRVDRSPGKAVFLLAFAVLIVMAVPALVMVVSPIPAP